MTKRQQRQSTGFKKNRLLRYQLILDIYNEHKTDYNSVMYVYREHIYPVYPISRVTLYKILNTRVAKELREVLQEEQRQLSFF